MKYDKNNDTGLVTFRNINPTKELTKYTYNKLSKIHDCFEDDIKVEIFLERLEGGGYLSIIQAHGQKVDLTATANGVTPFECLDQACREFLVKQDKTCLKLPD